MLLQELVSEPVFISESQVFDVVPGKLGKQGHLCSGSFILTKIRSTYLLKIIWMKTGCQKHY